MALPSTLVAVTAVLLAQPGSGTAPVADAGAPQPSLSTVLHDRQGKNVGVVTLTETPHGLLLRGTVSGLSPGPHAIHVHETGKCEPPFTSAGGHLNPGHKAHGMLDPAGPHAGDLPNLIVPANGKVDFETFAPGLTLSAVLDADGSSVVVHARADDHHSQPAGDSGDRIACGVVSR
jgi:Cu-Zn family superoxide dismutase